MKQRTTANTVTFRAPFKLNGFDEVLPAGSYSVETEEELLQSLSFEAYRRVSTVLRIPAQSGNPILARILPINPEDLEAALKRDQATGGSASAAEARPSIP